MKTQMKKWKGALVVLMVFLLANANGQFQGESWGSGIHNLWEYSQCNSNTVCNDSNPNTIDNCFNGYCQNEENNLSSITFNNQFTHSKTAPNGDVWFYKGNSSYGNLIKSDGTNFTTISTLASEPIIGNNDTVYYYNKNGAGIDTFKIYDGINTYNYHQDNSGLRGSAIIEMYEIHNDIWLLTDSGLNHFSNSGWMLYNENNTPLTQFFLQYCSASQGSNGLSYWYSSSISPGIGVFDGTNWSLLSETNSGLSNNIIGSIQFNTLNHAVISTFNNGIDIYDGINWVNYSFANGELSAPSYYRDVMLTATDDIWVYHPGTKNLDFFNGSTWAHYDIPATFLVLDVSLDKFDRPIAISQTQIHSLYNNKWISKPKLGIAQNPFIDVNNILYLSSQTSNFNTYQLPNLEPIDDLIGIVDLQSTNGKHFSVTPTGTMLVTTHFQQPTSHFIHKIDFQDNFILAQNDTLKVPQNITLDVEIFLNDIFGLAFQPYEASLPIHGSIVVNSNSIGNIIYTPNSNYLGQDSFKYYIQTSLAPITRDTATVYLEIETFMLDLMNDTFTTEANYSLSENIYLNDFINFPSFSDLLILSPVNFGTLETYDQGNFVYIPNDNNFGNFGIDSFQYSLCDTLGLGVCDTAWAYINISPSQIAANNDTFTISNTGGVNNFQYAINDSYTSPSFQLSIATPPANGTYGGFGSIIQYFPNTGFSGIDSLQYVICTNFAQVQCDSAWIYINVELPYLKTKNDSIDLGMDKSIALSYLSYNDSSNLSSISVNQSLNLWQPSNGSFTLNKYTPNTGYLGVDSFEYYASSTSVAITDTSWVYINVIEDTLHAENDTFTVVSNSLLSDTVVLNDTHIPPLVIMYIYYITSPINGTISNLNARGRFSYSSNLNYAGVDSFQYVLCEDTLGTICDSAWVYLNILPLPGDSVWPGDTNLDGIANNFDVLPIGIAYGSTGPVRPLATNNWNAQFANDWTNFVAPVINYKHSDCNGNGTIDSFDIDVINLNYGLTHSKGPGPKSINGIPLFLDINPQTHIAGSTVTGTINLGTIDTPAVDIYGIAFSLNYDNTIIEENTVSIDFSNSWLAPAVDRVNLDKDFWVLNKIDIGTSKTNQVNGTGFGPIASIEFNIQENLAGKTDEEIVKLLELSFTDILAVNIDFEEIDINGKTDTLYATQVVGIKNIPELEVKVYPNPVDNELRITAANKIASIQIINVLGQVLASYSDIESTNTAIPFEDFDKGIYFIQIVSENQAKANLRIIKK